MKRLARMARGGSQRVGPPKDRSPPKLIDAEQVFWSNLAVDAHSPATPLFRWAQERGRNHQMADPWLAFEVLRELDEANARYFALTLHSPRSRYYLEIPTAFTAETGWPSEEECALVTSMSTRQEWPLQIRRLDDVIPGVSAVSIGGGWAKFLQDQNLGEGAFLTFEVVDERRLVVALHNRSTPDDLQEPQQLHGDSDEMLDLLERQPPEAGDSQLTRSPLLSEAHGVERAQFCKKLRKTHTLKYDSSRLDVPTAYWRAHGLEGFDGVWYTLHGPLVPWAVKTSTHTCGKQTICSFTKGWAGFCSSNKLQLGNTVCFTKIGPVEFLVRKV